MANDSNKEGALLTDEDLPRFDEILSFLSNAEVQLLYEHLEEHELSPGEILFRQGEEHPILYIVSKGSFRIVIENKNGTRSVLTKITTGHIIGEISFLLGKSHSATVEADDEAGVYMLHRHHFDSIVLEDPTLAFKIVQAINKVLCYRLSRVNRELSTILHGEKK